MSKTSSLVSWIALLYAALFFIYWIQIYQNELVAFDEFVLDKQVNYAADAAVEELLMTGDTDQDYNNGDYSRAYLQRISILYLLTLLAR